MSERNRLRLAERKAVAKLKPISKWQGASLRARRL